ncbi:Integrase, catalytic region [hydrothermal vent metagenome]|uniref:Integrase, catalytic region n=1 Tax=hydrothermal vent metagenome TaxID=652676 RepID=A0A3B0XKH7_9ZZZZ
MTTTNLKTIEALQAFLDGNQLAAFAVLGTKSERYDFIRKTLVKFNYMSLPKKDKGIVIRYLIKMTGYSRQQLTRLIQQYTKTGKINWTPCRNNGFAKKYSNQDIALLAKTDALHDTPCGQAVKKICERAFSVFGDENYQRLSELSISHLYNLRDSDRYKKQRRFFTKTQARKVAIGERRKPTPEGKPGYIRIDTVHQGDLDKVKGVYHINAVDEVTQFEIVCSVEKISEQYLMPVLKQMLASFPFNILGFHSDNGSEYINHRVAELLQKLFVEFTKSRSRRSNDNALAESKNASVVRKIFGYEHIPQRWATEINAFNRKHLNPYINYHRPCFFPKTITDNKGKQRKIYRYKDMMTPYDKLKSLTDAGQYLKPEISFEILDEYALKISDNKAASELQKARKKLFSLIFKHPKTG